MKIELPYGEETLEANIPSENLTCVLEREKRKGVGNYRKEILKGLRDPIGTPPLRKIVESGDEVAIIVSDNTRPSPSDKLLPPLLEELKAGGVEESDVKITIAYGLHSHLDKKGLVDLLGGDIVERYEIIHHDPEDTIHLGQSSRGIPIEVNRNIVEADFRISTGVIEPHFFAGFSGGRKSIMPGVSSRKAIYGNHGYQMIDNPNSRPGVLEENPIYQDSVEHAKKANLDFILNAVLNKEKEVTNFVAGHPYKAYTKGVEYEKKMSVRETECKAEIVITTNSGAPLDLNLYQTVKGIYHASIAAKKDGVIIVASKCNEGIGPASFEKLHDRANSPDEVIEFIRKEEPIGVQWENQILANVQKNQEIYLKSSLENEEVRRFMINPIEEIEEGLEEGFEKFGKDAKVITLAEGPMVIPKPLSHS